MTPCQDVHRIMPLRTGGVVAANPDQRVERHRVLGVEPSEPLEEGRILLRTHAAPDEDLLAFLLGLRLSQSPLVPFPRLIVLAAERPVLLARSRRAVLLGDLLELLPISPRSLHLR